MHRGGGNGGWRKHLVTIVSQSFELVYLGVRILQPEQCLLLYTPSEPSIVATYDRLCELLAEQNVACLPGKIPDSPQAVGKIAELLQPLTETDLPGGLAVDLTPGKRLMTLALLAAAPPGARLMCWWSDTDGPTRRVIPGSKRIHIWEYAASGRIHPLTYHQ